MNVAVVGAGLAGLACAARLHNAGVGVTVYEAADRMGGRVRTAADVGSGVWELGAQVIHPAGMELDREFELGAVPAQRVEFLMLVEGQPIAVRRAAMLGIRPWELDAALPADGRADLAQWLAGRLRGTPLPVGQAFMEQEWGARADLLSVGDMAEWYARRSCFPGSEQTMPQGLSQLVDRLAVGVDVRLGCPVDRVTVHDGGARAYVAGSRVDGDAVVVTVPPWLLRTQGQRGGLVLTGVPERQVTAAAELPGGDAVAALVRWSHAAPVSAIVFDPAGGGFLRCRMGNEQIQLVSKGPHAAVLRRLLASPAQLDSLLRRALRWTDGGSAVEIECADWGLDQWTRGAFSAPTIGHNAARAAGRALERRGLLFAGEADRRDGSAARIHGAVQSGRDAALRLLSALEGSAVGVLAASSEGDGGQS